MGTVGLLVIVVLQVAKSVNQMVHQHSAPIVFNAGSSDTFVYVVLSLIRETWLGYSRGARSNRRSD